MDIKNYKESLNDELDEIRICPDCGHKVLWGNMIWLNGKTRCPQCHEVARKQLDNQRHTDWYDD